MGNRRVPDRAEAKYERFRQLAVERLIADPALALAHSHARNASVAKVLCYVALIRLGGGASQSPIVICSAAERQFFSAPGGFQAAHLLPGQIKIDGLPPWAYLAGEPARLLENLFAYVEPLHANFNKADSAAEAHGLTLAFADACRAVLVGTGQAAREIEIAYSQIWAAGARRAFEAAALQKRGRPTPPALVYGEPGSADYNTILNLEERGEAFATESIRDVFKQLSILDYYKASLGDPPRELSPEAVRAIIGV